MTYPSYLLQYLLQEKEESQDSKPTLLVREGRKAPALGRATRAGAFLLFSFEGVQGLIEV